MIHLLLLKNILTSLNFICDEKMNGGFFARRLRICSCFVSFSYPFIIYTINSQKYVSSGMLRFANLTTISTSIILKKLKIELFSKRALTLNILLAHHQFQMRRVSHVQNNKDGITPSLWRMKFKELPKKCWDISIIYTDDSKKYDDLLGLCIQKVSWINPTNYHWILKSWLPN